MLLNSVLNLKVKEIYFYFMHMSDLPACVCVLCPWRPEKGMQSLGTGVTGGYELLPVSWKANLDPLGKQQIVLTTELPLQTPPDTIS